MKEKQVIELNQLVSNTIYRENDKGLAAGFDVLCTATEYLAEKITEDLYKANYRKQTTGKWITTGEELKNTACSVCGHWVETPYGKTKYCSECGSKMEVI